MNYFAALALVFLTGAGFSLAAFLSEDARKNRVLHVLGLGIFICLIGFAGSKMTVSSTGQALVAVPALALASAAWALFFAYWAVESVAHLARSAVGLNNLRVPPGYSPAEAALARRDFGQAERLYRELIDNFPDEPEPCRRLGELLLSRNRPAEAITCFKEAGKREPDPGVKIMHCFSIAEIMTSPMGDASGAIDLVEKFVAEYPACSVHGHAKERLAAMRAKLQTPPKDAP